MKARYWFGGQSQGSLALTFGDLRVIAAATYVRAHLRESSVALLLPLSYGSHLHI